MCMLCGDPFSLENVLSPLLCHQWAGVSSDRSIALHAFLGEWPCARGAGPRKTARPLPL